MKSIFISPPNAILFVLDPTNKNILVPPYVDGEVAAINKTCASIGTQAPVDGETEVFMSLTDDAPSSLKQVLFGKIDVPGGKVAVVTSDFKILIECEVNAGFIELSVWVEDLQNPSKVFIKINQNKVF